MPSSKATSKTTESGLKRTTFEISIRDQEEFLALAKGRETTISALFHGQLLQFRANDVRNFDFQLLAVINANLPQKIVTFRLTSEAEARLQQVRTDVDAVFAAAKLRNLKQINKDVTKIAGKNAEEVLGERKLRKNKILGADIVRYIIHLAVRATSDSIEAEVEAEKPEKTMVIVLLPEEDYKTVCVYAKEKGTTANRLLAQLFPDFTDDEFNSCSVEIEMGRKTDQSRFRNPDNDPRGLWTPEALTGLYAHRPGMDYEIINPLTGVACHSYKYGWRYTKERMAQLIRDNRISWPTRKNGMITRKKFLSEIEVAYCRTSINIYASMYPDLKAKSERLKVSLQNVIKVFIVFLADKIREKRL